MTSELLAEVTYLYVCSSNQSSQRTISNINVPDGKYAREATHKIHNLRTIRSKVAVYSSYDSG